MRVTVKIIADGIAAKRDFHLDANKAERFAAKVRAEGGKARIVPLQLGAELRAMLAGAGVNPYAVR